MSRAAIDTLTTPGEATDGNAGRRDSNGQPSVAAQLCWQAAVICRVLDDALADLQLALSEVTERTNAILEIALEIDERPDQVTDRPRKHPVEVRP